MIGASASRVRTFGGMWKQPKSNFSTVTSATLTEINAQPENCLPLKLRSRKITHTLANLWSWGTATQIGGGLLTEKCEKKKNEKKKPKNFKVLHKNVYFLGERERENKGAKINFCQLILFLSIYPYYHYYAPYRNI